MTDKSTISSHSFVDRYPKDNSHERWMTAFRQQLKKDGVRFILLCQNTLSEDSIVFNIWARDPSNVVIDLAYEQVTIKLPVSISTFKNKTELEIISQLFIDSIERRHIFLVPSIKNRFGTWLRRIKRRRHQRPLMYRITRLLGLVK